MVTKMQKHLERTYRNQSAVKDEELQTKIGELNHRLHNEEIHIYWDVRCASMDCCFTALVSTFGIEGSGVLEPR